MSENYTIKNRDIEYYEKLLGKPLAYWIHLEAEVKRKKLENILPDTIMENILLKKQLEELEIKYSALEEKIRQSLGSESLWVKINRKSEEE